MKSNITTDNLQEIEPTIPGLYRCRTEGKIVLFSDIGSGCVVFLGTSTLYYVGYTSTKWIPCTNKAHWEYLPPNIAITLSN